MVTENQTKKTVVSLPKSTSFDEIRDQNQQLSFIKNHYFCDKWSCEEEGIHINTFLTGKHFFLRANPEKLEFMALRIDLSIHILKQTNYFCEIEVDKFIIRYGNKIIYSDDFGTESEVDKQFRRTYVLNAVNFIDLIFSLTNYFAKIFYEITGVKDPEQYPIIIMDGIGEEITNAHYEFDEKDSDEIQMKKMEIEKMLRDTYEQRFKEWAEKKIEIVRKKFDTKEKTK